MPRTRIAGIKDAGAGWRQRRKYTASTNMSAARVAITDIPSGGEYVVVDDLVISCGAALLIVLSEEDGPTLCSVYLAANSTVQISTRGKLVVETSGKRLMAQSNGAGNIAITALFHTDPAPFNES